jgi:DNA-binding transcriptional ArsR family regulator
MVMWDFLARSWAMSYGREHVAIDDEVTRRHIEAIKEAGIAPLLYMSGWFYYSRDAVEFAEEVKRVRDRYQTAGVYLDGLPTEWVTAYEEIRLIREIFPDGLILLHHTCPAPLMEASIELPAVASYVDSTNMAELIYGKGKDWAYPKYFVSQYRKANTVGTMIHDHWDYGGRGDRDVMMLRYNGRAFAPGLPWETGIEDDTFAEWVGRYLSAIEELKTLWEEKGDDAEFYERYYLPKVLELTDQDLPEA